LKETYKNEKKFLTKKKNKHLIKRLKGEIRMKERKKELKERYIQSKD